MLHKLLLQEYADHIESRWFHIKPCADHEKGMDVHIGIRHCFAKENEETDNKEREEPDEIGEKTPWILCLHGTGSASPFPSSSAIAPLGRARRFSRMGHLHRPTRRLVPIAPEEMAGRYARLIEKVATQICGEQPITVVAHSWGACVPWAWCIHPPPLHLAAFLLVNPIGVLNLEGLIGRVHGYSMRCGFPEHFFRSFPRLSEKVLQWKGLSPFWTQFWTHSEGYGSHQPLKNMVMPRGFFKYELPIWVDFTHPTAKLTIFSGETDPIVPSARLVE